MDNKKTTPKSRALQRSARQAQSATKRAAVYGTPTIQESGAGWGNVARAAVAAAKKYGQTGPKSGKTVGSSISGGTVPRTKSVQKYEARAKQVGKKAVRQATRPAQSPKRGVPKKGR
jgi:hypothetical protein